jgi:hypothetical protein
MGFSACQLIFYTMCYLSPWEWRMPMATDSKEARELRKQGLRRVEVWVPDRNAPAFREEAHRQSLAVAQSPQAEEDQAYVDAISDWPEK